MQAHDEMTNPSDETRELCGNLRELSTQSESTSRADRFFEDGSVLVLTSEQGAEVQMETFNSEADTVPEGAWVPSMLAEPEEGPTT